MGDLVVDVGSGVGLGGELIGANGDPIRIHGSTEILPLPATPVRRNALCTNLAGSQVLDVIFEDGVDKALTPIVEYAEDAMDASPRAQGEFEVG